MTKFFKLFTVLLTVASAVFFYSCEKFDKVEPTPSFIYIDKITLADNGSINEGSLSSNIVDAWVYVDDNLIGAFELPCTIPVLEWGEHEVKVKAGIYLNGVKTTRVPYPFYKEYKSTITLGADSITKVKPTVRYEEETVFEWMENFEVGGIKIENGSQSTTTIIKTNDPDELFEGNYSGKIHLSDTDSVYIGVSIDAMVLPMGGSNVFLELDYKNTNDIIIGIYANKPTQVIQSEVLGILPKDEWNKIYVNLTTAISRETDAEDFKIFIGSYLREDETEADILIDNIKLLHY